MARNKISVTKQQGGLGRKVQNADNVIGLIAGGVAVSGKLVLGTRYVCNSIKDVKALGIDAAYDSANTVLLYRRLERIYTRNKSAEVHLMVVAQATLLAEMVNIANGTPYGKNLLRSAGGRIKYLGIVRNPSSYDPDLSDGLDVDVLDAVGYAQELYNSEAAEFRYAQIVIEGRYFNGTVGSAIDLRTLEAPNVSVAILADPSISKSNEMFNNYAAVEDVLGCLSVAAVSQNIGENNKTLFNLQNVARGYYNDSSDINGCIGLSSNSVLSSYNEADLQVLNDKGYIFGEPVTGLAGLYLNDSHTCDVITSDYAYIENNATIDKATALARTALLPKVNARLKADTESGQLAAVEEQGLISIAIDSLEGMEKDGDISGGRDAEINPDNPDYDLLAGDDLVVAVSFIPMAIGRTISLQIGFNNPKKAN